MFLQGAHYEKIMGSHRGQNLQVRRLCGKKISYVTVLNCEVFKLKITKK